MMNLHRTSTTLYCLLLLFQFKVIASDKSWKPKTNEADVVINVTRVDAQTGDLRFYQPFY